jgi:putative redox protein
MAIQTVQAKWVEARVFHLQDHNDFPLVMTQPEGVNGADLLPLSLIGCSAWDVLDILQKQRQVVTGLEVTAESEREETAPWAFLSIRIRYKIRGRGLKPEAVRRAIDLSETKYCSVYVTLRKAIDLSSEFEIIEE